MKWLRDKLKMHDALCPQDSCLCRELKNQRWRDRLVDSMADAMLRDYRASELVKKERGEQG